MTMRRLFKRAMILALGAGTVFGITAPAAFAQGGQGHGRFGGGGGAPTFTITCTEPVYNGTYTTVVQAGPAKGRAMAACEEAGGTATSTSSRGGEGE